MNEVNSKQDGPLRVAYVMSRFPKISETFVLYEMLAVQAAGVEVELYPLQREKTTVMHPEAVSLVARANFTPWFSFTILMAHFYFLMRRPVRYFATLWILLRENFGSFRFLFGAIAFFPKAVYLARLMSKQGIDHLHAHFASHPAMVAFVIHRLADIPFSFTAHGSDLHRDQHMLKVKVEAASFVAAISEYNRKMIVELCGPSQAAKTQVVHCGVDVTQFQVRPQVVRRESHFSITCIGTLHEVKGQTYLLDAAGLLKQCGYSFEIHLVGDGPDRENLQAQVTRDGLCEYVLFHGSQNRHWVMQQLQATDLLVTPSVFSRDGRREGIPVVLMEAMASGVPVIASDISGIPELIEADVSGLLIPPRDAEAIADAIEQLMTDSQRCIELAANARRRVEQEFNQQKTAEFLAQIFNEEAGREQQPTACGDEPVVEVRA